MLLRHLPAQLSALADAILGPAAIGGGLASGAWDADTTR